MTNKQDSLASNIPQPGFAPYTDVLTLVQSSEIHAGERVRISYLERRPNAGYYYLCVRQSTGTLAWFQESELQTLD